MNQYKKFLKRLLIVNMLFILTVAGIGYKEEVEEKKITEVSNNFYSEKRSNIESTERKVIPVGKTVGIYVNTKGILVIDTGEVTDMSGEKKTPAKNKLMPGDYVVELNGETVTTKKQLIQCITDCGGETLIFEVTRNGKETEVKIEPVETGVDTYKVGIWVRDDLQGLGTITYVEGNDFGALVKKAFS